VKVYYERRIHKMLNHIVVQGRLTRDPEMRTTPAGVAVANFGIACDHDWTGKDSNERGVDFVNCVAWRGSAEFICRNFRKGQMCVVSGRLQIRDWKDKDGNNRHSAEVVADNIYFGDSKRDSDGGSYNGSSYAGGSSNSYRSYGDSNSAPAGGSNYAAPAAPAASDFAMLEDDDSELPF
jgi:single-strand DNA-binding protein